MSRARATSRTALALGLAVALALALAAGCGQAPPPPRLAAAPGMAAPAGHHPVGDWRARHGAMLTARPAWQGQGECRVCHLDPAGCQACHDWAGVRADLENGLW